MENRDRSRARRSLPGRRGTGWVGCRLLVALGVLGAGLFGWGCAAPEAARTGAGGFRPPVAGVEVVGSGGSTHGPLRLVRAELAFDNNLGEATVARGEPLGVCGMLRFDGNGLLRAVWEVDGRVLEQVSTHVVFGNTLRVCTGPAAVLPTFEPGPHQVTLRVQEPPPSPELPSVRYFVTGEPYQRK